MKITIATAALLLVLCTSSNLSYAQTLDKGYYIVVGAFSTTKESYAQKFTERLKNDGLKASYALDSKRHILLVYIEEFNEYSPSIKEMLAVRKQEKFPEAWVRIIKEALIGKEELKVKSEKLKEGDQVSALPVVRESVNDNAQVAPLEVPQPNDSIKQSPPPIVPSSVVPSSPRLTFHMFDANNSEPVEGGVEIVDTERARLIQKSRTTDTIPLPDPASKSHILSFITDVFGYRKLQHEVNYKQPLVDSSKHYFDQAGNYYVLQFEMVRYHKGDVATLYNVFFFNDAAIMMPESRYELNKLLELMQSNNKYRIKLHGHTNGNSHGKIITMGPSKNFFSVNAPDVKQHAGSAKVLSGQRAEVIREWLIAQGISADRIEVKSWGGSRMIHDRNSANARKNVRVEVEVLSE